MNNSSAAMLISIPSVLCGDDSLSPQIAASFAYIPESGWQRRHCESCVTEVHPVISGDSVTSFCLLPLLLSTTTSNLSLLTVCSERFHSEHSSFSFPPSLDLDTFKNFKNSVLRDLHVKLSSDEVRGQMLTLT